MQKIRGWRLGQKGYQLEAKKSQLWAPELRRSEKDKIT